MIHITKAQLDINELVSLVTQTLLIQAPWQSWSVNPSGRASSRTLSGNPSGTCDGVPLKNSSGGRNVPSDRAERTTVNTGLFSDEPDSWRAAGFWFENCSKSMKTENSSMEATR